MTPVDPFLYAARISEILNALDIRYAVGGSVASMLYGEPRSTTDLDIVIEVDEESVHALTERLKDEYYVDAADAIDAVRLGSTFNAIHLQTSMKVDFFIAEDRDDVRVQLGRRQWRLIGDTEVAFYAPEDIVIRKLMWFRMTGEQSERQWRDIMGVLRIGKASLDDAYLDRAAASFDVADLLTRAREDAAHP